jgi:hypothetical protein
VFGIARILRLDFDAVSVAGDAQCAGMLTSGAARGGDGQAERCIVIDKAGARDTTRQQRRDYDWPKRLSHCRPK